MHDQHSCTSGHRSIDVYCGCGRPLPSIQALDRNIRREPTEKPYSIRRAAEPYVRSVGGSEQAATAFSNHLAWYPRASSTRSKRPRHSARLTPGEEPSNELNPALAPKVTPIASDPEDEVSTDTQSRLLTSGDLINTLACVRLALEPRLP